VGIYKSAFYLEDFLHDEDVFGFDIAMEDAIAMHVVHSCTISQFRYLLFLSVYKSSHELCL